MCVYVYYKSLEVYYIKCYEREDERMFLNGRDKTFFFTRFSFFLLHFSICVCVELLKILRKQSLWITNYLTLDGSVN